MIRIHNNPVNDPWKKKLFDQRLEMLEDLMGKQDDEKICYFEKGGKKYVMKTGNYWQKEK